MQPFCSMLLPAHCHKPLQVKQPDWCNLTNTGVLYGLISAELSNEQQGVCAVSEQNVVILLYMMSCLSVLLLLIWSWCYNGCWISHRVWCRTTRTTSIKVWMKSSCWSTSMKLILKMNMACSGCLTTSTTRWDSPPLWHAQTHIKPVPLAAVLHQVHFCFAAKLEKLWQSSHQAQSTDLSQVQGS